MSEVFKTIQNEIDGNDVVLFMKGTGDMPLCGFSGTVVMILNKLGLPFKAINVLEDEEVRQGIKDFSNWPTIPQLYLKGEFVGGCDIVKEMFLTGDFQKLLDEKQIKYNK